jgi:hypothetical protein
MDIQRMFLWIHADFKKGNAKKQNSLYSYIYNIYFYISTALLILMEECKTEHERFLHIIAITLTKWNSISA